MFLSLPKQQKLTSNITDNISVKDTGFQIDHFHRKIHLSVCSPCSRSLAVSEDSYREELDVSRPLRRQLEKLHVVPLHAIDRHWGREQEHLHNTITPHTQRAQTLKNSLSGNSVWKKLVSATKYKNVKGNCDFISWKTVRIVRLKTCNYIFIFYSMAETSFHTISVHLLQSHNFIKMIYDQVEFFFVVFLLRKIFCPPKLALFYRKKQ